MSSPVASPAEKSDPPKRKRGWRWLLQFRLRTILILTTVVAIWLGWWLNSARQQREAVAELRKVGADVWYDFQSRGHDRPLYWPAWLINSLGVDCCADVGAVYFIGTQVTDAGLEHLKGLTSLQKLWLKDNTQVSDVGLEHLKGLTSLQILGLEDNTQVTDAGLEHLKDLTSLQYLLISHTQVTDAALEHLKDLTLLPELWLPNTQVTDAGLEHLKHLTSLQRLGLNDTQVTDAGLVHLKDLTSLQGLALDRTQVTDAGLEHLKDLTSLQILSLDGTRQVTLAGLERLQESLPDCDISR